MADYSEIHLHWQNLTQAEPVSLKFLTTLKENIMKTRLALLVLGFCLASPPALAEEFSWDPLKDVENVLPQGVPNEGKIIQARDQVREMSQDALASLNEIAPGARYAIDRAAGYAVFSTFGIKLFFAGGTTGKGLVVNQRTHRQTYMQMVQVQGGLGFGVNKNRLIFVFTTQNALNNFINQGWEFGGQGNLSAMAGGKGGMFSGAASVAPGVFLYQITDTGLSASLTVSGTKFFRDPDLN